MKEAIVIGPGYMGEATARLLKEVGQEKGFTVGSIVDATDSKTALADSLNASLVVLNPRGQNPLTQGEIIDIMAGLVHDSDICTISVPTEQHPFYLRQVLGGGVSRVLIEKPTTGDPEDTKEIIKQFPEALVQVDYIERAQAVVLAAIDEMKRNGFVPAGMFNWRSHDVRNIAGNRVDSGDLTKVLISDLVHDLSEFDLIMNQLTGFGLENGQPDVINVDIKSWRDLYPETYPLDSDAKVDFIVRLSNGVEGRIKGDSDEDERRYFVVWNEDRSEAYFVNTLTRTNKGINPVATRVTGQQNVARLFVACEEGNMQNDEDFDMMFRDSEARKISTEEYEQNALKTMIRNLADAEKPEDLISPVRTALAIEHVVVEVYKTSGKDNLLTSKVVANW